MSNAHVIEGLDFSEFAPDPDIPGLAVRWTTDVAMLALIDSKHSVLEQRGIELFGFPQLFPEEQQQTMYYKRGQKFVVLDTRDQRVYDWSPQRLVTDVHLIEIPMLDPRSIAGGIPKAKGVEVPDELKHHEPGYEPPAQQSARKGAARAAA